LYFQPLIMCETWSVKGTKKHFQSAVWGSWLDKGSPKAATRTDAPIRPVWHVCWTSFGGHGSRQLLLLAA
jgi:hypothetical protein